MRERRWLLLALYGFLLATAVSGALKATRPKFKIATTSTTTTTTEESNDEEVTTVSSETNGTTGHTLTGIPQIDYIWDPNLPRELNGYNLSEYPFYNSIPEDIDFKCDGLHDGFYASVPHKCQVYHHCLFGTRYDFLCANFTAFDQKTFICHFVSEVDCVNSKKYWHRNDALYKAATTTTTSTTTTAAPATAPPTRPPSRDRDGPRRRRPFRRRPAYDYYDEDYYDDDFDRTRSRGYDRRDDYDYEDRKYRRDRDRDRDFRERDRDYRDRDTRDRDSPRMRDDRERDREMTPRERFPVRSNRRDTPRGGRDPAEEDAAVPRTKEQDQGSRSREIDDADVDDRRTVESRNRDSDDRRYADKRHKDEYDDKDSAAPVPAAAASTEGLVKPAAPSTSLYSRPRAPPKIRRPVPLSEQDKYAYKTTSVQTSAEEPRRRPADLIEDDYYEDDLEEVRPRRPMRRRPAYRERDRDFYDSREIRDRDRDRPFRSRYQDEDDDIRLRKHPERSRDRFYERERERDRGIDRGRDRSLDRGKDRTLDRSLDRERDRTSGRSQDTDRSERPSILARPLDRERDNDRSRSSSRTKDPLDVNEPTRRPSIYDRTTEKPSTSTAGTTGTTVGPVQEPKADQDPIVRSERPPRPGQRLDSQNPSSGRSSSDQREIPSSQDHPDKSSGSLQHSDTQITEGQETSEHQDSNADDYPMEYYDELEDSPVSSPKTTVRIVKRPFLPSRGGNPNPRGLLPVGSRATGSSKKDEDRSISRVRPVESPKADNVYPEDGEVEDEVEEVEEEEEEDEEEMELSEPNQELKRKSVETKTPYDAYKAIQTDFLQKQRPEESDTTVARPTLARRPFDGTPGEDISRPTGILPETSGTTRVTNRGPNAEEGPQQEKSISEDLREQQRTAENVPTTSGSPNRGKVRYPPTEVNLYSSTYKTDDILNQPTGPASLRAKQRLNEVTHRLQDIPESEYDVTLNDALTPTLNQESGLPSGFVLPLHRQTLGRDAVLQPSENNYQFSRPLNDHHQHQQQQKPFVPSPQFIPLAVNERPRTVYYRTPETIHISGSQYRQQRGPWHDYTGY